MSVDSDTKADNSDGQLYNLVLNMSTPQNSDETNMKPQKVQFDADIPPKSSFKPMAPPPHYTPTISKRFISAFSMFYIFLSAYLGSIFMQGFFLPLVYLFPNSFKQFVETSMLLWFRLTEIVLSKFMGIKIRHFGDSLTEKEGPVFSLPNFILMTNHRTRLDWFYFWLIGQHFHSMKICLKGELAHIPGAGWAMQFGNFLFLKRRLELDKLRIRQLVNYLKVDKVQVFIFPEGTDLSPEAMRRGAIYSKKTGKINPDYTLHPRTSGIIHLINSALPDHLDYLYDVTVAYPGNFSVNETQIISGYCPENVHLLWNRIPVKDLPLEIDEATGQLQAGDKVRALIEDIWAKKEILLKEYYSLPMSERKFPNALEHELTNTCFSNNTTRQLNFSSNIILIYWGCYNSLVIYLIYTNYIIRLYFFLFHFVVLFISYRRTYGLSDFIAELSGYPLYPKNDQKIE